MISAEVTSDRELTYFPGRPDDRPRLWVRGGKSGLHRARCLLKGRASPPGGEDGKWHRNQVSPAEAQAKAGGSEKAKPHLEQDQIDSALQFWSKGCPPDIPCSYWRGEGRVGWSHEINDHPETESGL